MNINVNTNTGIYDLNSGVSGSQAVSGLNEQRMATVPADSVRYVKAGDTFSGEIVSLNDDGTVELLLGDNTKLNAFLSKDLGLSLGQTLSFTVSGASDSKISLTPLYANLDGNSAVGKALNEAGLPITKQNMDMVTSMMERGLPIDRGSLQNMAALSARYPLADPKSIVQMTELKIPLTEENIREFEAYKENQYKIADSLQELSDGFTELAGKSVSVNNEIFNLFLDGEKSIALKDALISAENGDISGLVKELSLDKDEINALIKSFEEGEELKDPSVANEETGEAVKEDTVLPKGASASDLNGKVTDDLHTLLGNEGAKRLSENMKAAGLPEAIASKVADNSLSAKDTLDLAKALLDKAMQEKADQDGGGTIKYDFKELLRSPEYKLLLSNGITNEFLLKPEEVSDKERVKEYYERVVKNSDKAIEFLNSKGLGSSALSQGVNNLRSNVDFMNQLNNVMTYLQLPLKMNEDKAHGDLYVYTNKKNLSKKDGNVSALLHLDMQHLGTMDIHVQMTDYENVKTHFILQKEEMLDFIAEHLPELDEAINKRGYKMHSDVALNREARDVPDIMFNRGTNEKLIQTTSFDIRA